jgi:hypothetical protein
VGYFLFGELHSSSGLTNEAKMASPIGQTPDRLSPPLQHSPMTSSQRRRQCESSKSRALSGRGSTISENYDTNPTPEPSQRARIPTTQVTASSPVITADTTRQMSHEPQTHRRREEATRANSDPSSNTSRTSPPRHDSDNWTESDALVPRRNLTELDVAALILNKMVTLSSPAHS